MVRKVTTVLLGSIPPVHQTLELRSIDSGKGTTRLGKPLDCTYVYCMVVYF